MPMPPLTRAEAERMRDAIIAALEAGYPPRGAVANGLPSALRVAGEALGIPEGTMNSRLSPNGGFTRLGYTIPWEKYLTSDHQYIPPEPILKLQEEVAALKDALAKAQEAKDAPPKPRVISGKQDRSTRIVAIGDTHDSPHLPDKSRFKWFARHIAETRPDRVVQIGDFASWDSVSAHDAPGTANFAARPRFVDDLESLEEAMALFYNELGDCGIPMELTCGNHEDRISRFENASPETQGALYSQFEEIAARYRWRTHPYGRWLFIDGVGFTHAPFNQMGKPYGGKNPENAIANDAVFSIVWGHTHKAGFKRIPKIGPGQSVEVLNLGSAMPVGHVEAYANKSTTGWTYAIFDLEIRQGHIVGHREISLGELERMYA